MKRRAFITLLGGAVAAWPVAVRAQQGERMRRIGNLMNVSANDPEASERLVALAQRLQELGWTDGRNVRIDTRWAGAEADRYSPYAAELVALAPDVIIATTSVAVLALRQMSRTVPIVFVQVIDPVGAGFVASLARPGGNITGFTAFEYGLSAKWLEWLKQIAPHVTRVAVLRDASLTAGIGQFAALQAVAPALGVELFPIGVSDSAEIEPAIVALAGRGNGGLVVTASPAIASQREMIMSLAVQHKLPAVYPFRYYAVGGGLISYGPDWNDQYRLAAGYVDRILKGEKPANLPVQAPTKYELIINLKTAKAIDLTIPPSVLARADEVIE